MCCTFVLHLFCATVLPKAASLAMAVVPESTQGYVKVAAFQTVGALNIGKSEMARPPLPIPFFRVGTQDVTTSYRSVRKMLHGHAKMSPR